MDNTAQSSINIADLDTGQSPAVDKFYETSCWGCGLRLLLPYHAPVFKCGWCGAITNQDTRHKHEGKSRQLARLRDRCFICVLISFMAFLICGGVWAGYPVIFSINYSLGIFHSFIAAILSLSTLCTFRLAAFKCPGKPPSIMWGSYPVVGKGDLQNYTFCYYCSKPKSPRTHHCSTCQMCILDMDHHCPIIGNCVGAGNHRHFIFFLLSAIAGTAYLSIMSVYILSHIWPPIRLGLHNHRNSFSPYLFIPSVKEVAISFLSSAALLPIRGFILVYLFLAGISIGIGLSFLLWQQLGYIYEGKTYLSHLNSQGDGAEGDCQNLIYFFGFPYPISRLMIKFRNSWKRHKK